MKHNRSAISLVGFCVVTALGAALVFALAAAVGALALAGHQASEEPRKNPPMAQAPFAPTPVTATFNGMITDSYCGARHRKRSGQNSTECARTCVRKGAHYVLIDGDRSYRLAGADDVLDKLIGQRANVTGTRQGQRIVVSAVAPVAMP